MYDLFSAVAFQTDVWACRNRDDIERNLDRICEMIDSSAIYHYVRFTSPGLEHPSGRGTYAPLKLISLPELALNLPRGLEQTDIPEMIENLAISIPGPETDRLAALCRKNGYYLGCGAYETHPDFPEYIFNSQFLISPEGEIVAVHRKYNNWIPSESMPTSPHDVFDRYVEVFGKYKSLIETFFPVVDTEIGRLGMLTCNDGLYSENWRALAFQGAEVILHGNIPEPYSSSPHDLRTLLGRTNAFMQQAYVVSSAWGAKLNHPNPRYVSSGSNGVFIADFEGRIVAQADHPGETMTSAVLNLDELRRRRADPGSYSMLSHLRTEAYREMYSRTIYPPNLLLEEPLHSGSDVHRRDVQLLGVVDRMYEMGMLSTPYTDRRDLP